MAVKKTNLPEVIDKGSDVAIVNPENLIMAGIKQGLSTETMEKLLAMRRELKEESAKENYFRSLSSFQAECPIITKNNQVTVDGKPRYRYASLDDIVRQVAKLLEKHGFSYNTETRQTETMVTAVCKSHHVDGHSESTEFSIPIDAKAYMSAPQKVASALTYGKRYAFCNAFGIMTGDADDDASSARDKPAARKTEKAPAPQAQRPPVMPTEPPQERTGFNRTPSNGLTPAQQNKNKAALEKMIQVVPVSPNGLLKLTNRAETILPTEFEKEIIKFIGLFLDNQVRNKVFNDDALVTKIIGSFNVYSILDLQLDDALLAIGELNKAFDITEGTGFNPEPIPASAMPAQPARKSPPRL